MVPERSEQEVKILKVKLEKLEKEKEKEEENLAKVMESLKTETLVRKPETTVSFLNFLLGPHL